MKIFLIVFALASIGCAATHEVAATYDWEPEPSSGVEYTFHQIDQTEKTAFGPVAGIGVNYTNASAWGEARRSVRLKGGVRLEHGFSPRWWTEIGLRPHLYLGWDDRQGGDGTWAELTGYARAGVFFDVGDTQMGPFLGVDHQFSNAARDTPGEHPREPGMGLMVGWTIRW